MMKKSVNAVRAILVFMAAILAACGGSGGSTTAVKGIAAGGAPIAGATVTLKDTAGNIKTATTKSDGTFSVDVTGLTPPFILSVAGSGGPYYSYAGSTDGSANLTPYTTLLLQAYYGVQSTSATAVFANPASGISIPSGALDALQSGLVDVIQIYLADANVPNSSSFNFFTTAFTADHTGFDQVLDRTTLTGTTTFTVDNGSGSTAGTVSSTISTSSTPASGGTSASVSFSTSTTDGSSTSTSQQSVPVGGSSSQQNDLDFAKSGVLQMFTAMIQTAHAKGANLQASDLDAYVDANFLEDNQDKTAMENNIVDFFHQVPSGATVTPTLYRVYRFTDNSSTNQQLNVTVDLKVSSGGTTVDNYLSHGDFGNDGEVYRLGSGGAWAFYGHQNYTRPHIQLEAETFRDPNSNANSGGLLLQAQVSTDQALGITGVDVGSAAANSLPDCSSYAGPDSNTPMTKTSLSLMKDSGTFNGNQDRFDLPCYPSGQSGQSSPVMIDPASAPAAGTPYAFTVKNSGGTLETDSFSLNAFTTELIHIQTINGTASQTFAGSTHASGVAGQTLTLTYSMPTTFPVAYSYLAAFCQNQSEASMADGGGGNGGGVDIEGDLNQIPAGTNSGTISIPATCDGAAPYTLGVSAYFVGTNGEVTYAVQNLLKN